jgi:hypothetical protein
LWTASTAACKGTCERAAASAQQHPGAAARNLKVGGKHRIPGCCLTELFAAAKC